MFYCTHSICPKKDCPRHLNNINPRLKYLDYVNFKGQPSCPIEQERKRKEYENKGKA